MHASKGLLRLKPVISCKGCVSRSEVTMHKDHPHGNSHPPFLNHATRKTTSVLSEEWTATSRTGGTLSQASSMLIEPVVEREFACGTAPKFIQLTAS